MLQVENGKGHRAAARRIAIAGLLSLVSGSLPAESLIAPGSSWRYDDTGTDLGTAWRDTGYDDSGWASGPAQLGYGDGDESTVLSYGDDPNAKHPTYYFRRALDVADPGRYEALALRVLRDDGCIVYLNGTEVARSNLPEGTVTHDTWASSSVSGSGETAWHEFPVDPGLLLAGSNVVAVELHQVSASDSDVSLDLELEGAVPPEVTLDSPDDQQLVNTTSPTFRCSATDPDGLIDATLYVGEEPTTVRLSGPEKTADAQITADSPDSNSGESTAINVDGENPHAHAVLAFPGIFDDAGGPVPRGATIVSAALEVACFNPGNVVRLYRLTEGWDEAEVTWNERAEGLSWSDPGADGPGSNAGTALDGDCTATGTRRIDITPFVQAWSDGTANLGVVFTDTGTDGVDFDSSEGGEPPVLEVTYQSDWQAAGTWPLSGTADSATFSDVVLDDLQDYVWNCRVTNASGEALWAPADHRLSVDTGAPDEPVLVAPAGGATGVDTSPTLEVTVSDPQGDALEVSFYGRPAAGDEFTIIPLPDTQKYVLDTNFNTADIFGIQTRWIADQIPERNIVFVTHEGDIVETWNNATEWDRADAAMSVLNPEPDLHLVPWGVLPGNHDMDVSTRDASFYNTYFPPSRFPSVSNGGWYAGSYPPGTNENNYELFTAGGIDFIILHMAFCPTGDAITWANDVLQNHLDRLAIITTHGYMDGSGARDVHVCGSTQYIWDDLVAPNDNVHLVLCGHVSAEHARTDTVDGRVVHQLLADYQARENGGNGWLRILHFVPFANRVHVETYSPYLDRYETDADSQFSFDFPLSEYLRVDTVTGVASGSTVATQWPNLDDASEYEWYVEVTDATGKTQKGPVWRFTTGSQDTSPPVISGVVATNVTAGEATISWTTDEPADSRVDYGLDTTYGFHAEDATLVTSHAIRLTGLSPETTYHYQVTSTDSSGNPASSQDHTFATVADTTAPVAPTGLAAVGGDGRVDLDWEDNTEGDLDGYHVYRGTTSGGPYERITSSVVSTSDYSDTSVTNGTVYYYVVTALDTGGNESGPSGEARATPSAGTAIHVGSITMHLQKKGPNHEAQAGVSVVDSGGSPMSSVTVVGDWLYTPSGGTERLLESGATGMTRGDGSVLLRAPKVRAADGDRFTFRVTDLQKEGTSYDAAANTESEDSIVAGGSGGS